MSEIIDQSSTNVNPYSAPRAQATLGFGKLLTLTIIVLVVSGFLTAGILAYRGFLRPDEPSETAADDASAETKRQIQAYEDAARKSPVFPRTGRKQ